MIDYPPAQWDCVVSNLALHYVADLERVFANVRRTLKPGSVFLFNIEHPSFTAGVHQDWIYDADGRPLYRPIDNYFLPGERSTRFLGCGFELLAAEEAQPSAEMMEIPGMADELLRPMMLLVKAKAKEE